MHQLKNKADCFSSSFTMRQNEADGIRLRERQHGNIHFHGGAVGGVDVKSALWGHNKQLAPFHRSISSNTLHEGHLWPQAARESVRASHFFGPVGGRLRVAEAVLRLLQPLPFGPLVECNHRLHCPVCRGSKKNAKSVYLVQFPPLWQHGLYTE